MSLRNRILLSISIGLISGLISFLGLHSRGMLASDFQWSLKAGQYLLEGKNPYEQIPSNYKYPYDSPYFYPLPTAIFSILFSPFEPYSAGGLFFGFTSGLLAFAILSKEPWRWPVFLSPCFFIAATVAQWSPLIMAAALLPPAFRALSFLKPSLGISAFLYRPNLRAITIALIAVCASMLIFPLWPVDWFFATIRSGGRHLPPILFPGGFLLLLSILAIRKPEGRTLFSMAFIPRHSYWYDGVLLWLLPRSAREGMVLSVLGWIAYFGWKIATIYQSDLLEYLTASWPWQIGLMYLPTLIMVAHQEFQKIFCDLIPRLKKTCF